VRQLPIPGAPPRLEPRWGARGGTMLDVQDDSDSDDSVQSRGPHPNSGQAATRGPRAEAFLGAERGRGDRRAGGGGDGGLQEAGWIGAVGSSDLAVKERGAYGPGWRGLWPAWQTGGTFWPADGALCEAIWKLIQRKKGHGTGQ